MSFDTFVWKIASRCNLDCSYCYVYNLGDDSWKSQPKLMSERVAAKAAGRVLEHALERGLTGVVINFHGGEPFLGGTRHLRSLLKCITDVFQDTGIRVSTAIQTNGLLFTDEIGDLLAELGIGLYVSVDGPPETNDKNRLDLRGRPIGGRLDAALPNITGPRHRAIFAGFLSVVDVRSNPREVVDYLSAHQPPMIDFLLPLNNHDRVPAEGVAAYGDWLCTAFDYWLDQQSQVRVRTFDDIILRLMGEGAVNSDSEYLVVETDGSLELDDTLKTAYAGAAKLDMNIFAHSLAQVAELSSVQAMRNDLVLLCDSCRACNVVNVCRGGHVSHRYSEENGLRNPSVYCAALQQLIVHVWRRLVRETNTTISPPV
ncbi:radical SAM protein [Nocardia ignorata]|uniref:Radical SAM core domain-containing protein n=1 Tax=Nocardia ignorata TaxID=145285 RepID=A0A4V3CPE8_NOCIG|nr:radical SAM protein [Nocardia ignorata]TDP37692.1 uncharacterized protein DFR75_10442 [Nocardia ignorata]